MLSKVKRQKLLRLLFLSRSRHPRPAGFTLTELLVVVLFGGIIIAGLMKIVVDLVTSDFREFARTETQREMAQSLRFIASDLQQAIFVYDNIPGATDPTPAPPAAVTPLINLPQGTVLAFWVLEDLPYPGQNLPANCTGLGNRRQECNALIVRRTSYTFVVYTLEQIGTGTYEGPAQIVRYQLRQYDNLNNLALNSDYRDPTTPGSGGFAAWPGPNGMAYASAANGNVLTDFVDAASVPGFVDLNSTVAGVQFCPDDPSTPAGDYRRITPSGFGTEPTSFYACVRVPVNQAGNRDTGSVQDIALYLRGNALERSNLPNSTDATFRENNATYLPTLETQVQIRSVFQRDPTLIPAGGG